MRQDRKERLVAAILQGLGALFAVPILVLCIVRGAAEYGAAGVLAGLTFTVVMFALFLASMFHHIFGKKRELVRTIDYCSVFLLFAAAYTPVALIALMRVDAATAWVLFGVVWVMAAIGTVLSLIDLKRFSNITMACFLGLCWCIILCLPNLMRVMPVIGVIMLFAGAVSLAVASMIANPEQEPKKGHVLFHVLVLGGALCQGLMILLCVL